jgi:uncharacterized protein YeeX (DUF496 family)
MGLSGAIALGFFERQLQRRHHNVLFPAELRFPTFQQITEAKGRDRRERQEFLDEFRSVVTDIMSTADVVAYSVLDDYRSRVEDLIERASRIGGDTDKERGQLLTLFDTVGAAAEQSLSASQPSESVDIFRRAFAISKTRLDMISGLVGQITRADFPKDQITPRFSQRMRQRLQCSLTLQATRRSGQSFGLRRTGFCKRP